MTDLVDPIDVALAVTRALDAIGVTSTIGGSLASSVAGEPRSTVDIDIVAAINQQQAHALVARLEADFYIDEEALARAIRERRSTNLVHQRTQIKVDLWLGHVKAAPRE